MEFAHASIIADDASRRTGDGNQPLVSIRFVDGKVVEIDTLHEYGHLVCRE